MKKKNKYNCMDCDKITETYTLVGNHLKKEMGLCFPCYDKRSKGNMPKPLIY